MSVEDQPVARVEWVSRDTLRGNDYNPNHVAAPEMRLLKLSIVENGWTQPIVSRSPDPETGIAEIVDGFHRWTVSADPEVAALTGGLVPVVRITTDEATQRMATIRHNRARGTHAVVRMADIVADLVNEQGVEPAEVGRRLQMDTEEVKRLLLHGDMSQRGRGDGTFSRGWVPGGKTDTTEEPADDDDDAPEDDEA